jgi:predicted ATPase/DNA-binding CsgD family transcriptional regulator/tetratricopeptide (TPR) repeat protein
VPVPPNNLPLQLTSLVGREREMAAVSELLGRADVRLLTLTGPPGIGKTRLAIQVASVMLPDFHNGAYFIDLAPITDPSLVMPTIAHTLGLRQADNRPLFEKLKSFLHERQMLLVLDNFEQVMSAALQVAELLKVAAGPKVLVTSRELLHLSGEHNYPVPPLSSPPVLADQGAVRALAHLALERIATYDAVQLFTQRASALQPDFALTESNALTVAGICSRLDGLPLSIELAAARILHLPPQAILDRLQNRLRLLTGGMLDLPVRQRTLRAMIEWSYNLLNEDEQRLFRRLAVFQGGSTLAAIEAVCNADGDLGIEALAGVTSLIDKSLLRPESAERPLTGHPEPEGVGGKPYFAMLETIHEYAREQLDASNEAELIRQYHASYFLILAQRAEPQLRGPQQADWLNRLDRERENFRAALGWTYQYDIVLGLQLAALLGTFWSRRGHLSEGQEWLSKMLSRARDLGMPSTEAVAHVLYSAGFIAWHQGDLQAARPFLQESVSLFRELQDTHHTVDRKILAESLNILGIVVGRLDGIPARRSLHEEALAVARDSGEQWSIARSLYQLGHVARMNGDNSLATSLFEESLALFRPSGDQFNIGLALIGAGLMAQQGEDYELARSLFEESLAIYRALGVPWAAASVLYCLGSVALDQADYAGARSFLDESLMLERALGTRGDVAGGLENLGRAAYFQGDYSAAHSSYTASLTLFQETGDKYGMALCLMDLAGVMIAVGKATRTTSEPRHDSSGTHQEEHHRPGEDLSPTVAVRGAHLLGAAQALFESTGIQLDQMGRKLFDTYISAGRRQLGEPAFVEALTAGRAMDLESVISWAHSTSIRPEPGAEISSDSWKPTSADSIPVASSALTRREREVVTLLAHGKSNRQIAEALVVSERTVEWHTGNILSKLGLQSRSQIALWAVEQGLVKPIRTPD